MSNSARNYLLALAALTLLPACSDLSTAPSSIAAPAPSSMAVEQSEGLPVRFSSVAPPPTAGAANKFDRFNGRYTGSFSGTVFGQKQNGSVAFTVKKNVLTVTQPLTGRGTITSTGSGSFSGKLQGLNCRFTGNFKVRKKKINARGTWSCDFSSVNGPAPKADGSGTWQANGLVVTKKWAFTGLPQNIVARGLVANGASLGPNEICCWRVRLGPPANCVVRLRFGVQFSARSVRLLLFRFGPGTTCQNPQIRVATGTGRSNSPDVLTRNAANGRARIRVRDLATGVEAVGPSTWRAVNLTGT